MIRYALTNDDTLCCGCRACQQVCPVNAISMEANAEGFLYPVVDQTCCVSCSLCSQMCPMEHRPEGQSVQVAYAMQHRDEAVLKGSSSGGAFRLLADEVLQRGGCVVGCVWAEGNRPVLSIAESVEQLRSMQGSKYIFSDTQDIYQQVRRRVKAGQMVLFTGASCQCAGLLNYLGKPYENLITMDFLCHGMPSQKIFDSYILTLKRRYGANIYDIRFRDKQARGWGMAFSFRYQKNGEEKKVCNIGWTDPYQYGFIQGYFNRYSCYTCPFRGEPRFTDLTLSDYWGVERHHPGISSEKGVSSVSVNSEKGRRLQEALAQKADWTQTGPEMVAEGNPALLRKVEETIPALRHEMYAMVARDGWEAVARKHLRVQYLGLKKLWYRIPRNVTDKIKKILK